MNNHQLRMTEREQFRKDYSNEFLRNTLDAPNYGHDPYNNIGLDCGISYARALQVAQDRAMDGSLWSDIPAHVNHRPGV